MNTSFADILIIFGAKYAILLPVVIAAIFFLRQERKRQKEMLIFSVIFVPLAYLTLKLIGLFYNDPRPFVVGGFAPLIPHAPDNGFPSDHTFLSGAIAMSVFFFDMKLGAWLIALALIIGASRVFAGVHHPIDVAGSMISVVIFSSLVYRYGPWRS